MGTQVLSDKKRQRLTARFGWPQFDRLIVGTDATWAGARLITPEGHEHWAVNRRTGEMERDNDNDHWSSCHTLT